MDRELTLEKVEELGFPSWRHLQKLEAGKNFTLSTLHRLSLVYEMSPSEILKGLR